MNIKNNKNMTILLLLVVSAIIFTFFIYNIILLSTKYLQKEETLNNILLIERIDYIMNEIEKEKIYSAVYIAIKKETTINQLSSARKIVDHEIEKTLLFFNKNSIFKNQKDFFKEISKNLIEIRKKVDLSHNTDILKSYEREVIKLLNQNVEKFSQNFPLQYHDKVNIFEILINMKKNLNQETSLIGFILSTSKIMTSSELLLWEEIVKNDINPDFEKLANKEILKELREIIDPLEFSHIKDHERAEVFNYVLEGTYQLPIERWLNVSESKIDKINVAQDMLFIDIKSSLIEKTNIIKEQLPLLFTATIFFFLLILMLLYLNYTIRKNCQYLTKTLKDLEKDLNEKQKLEIHEVIKKNNTIEIYKFLANAIKEPNKEKDNFLANMSHEIRTPLNGIIGFTNLLKEENLNETQLEFVNIIKESSNNLLYIVNDILDFAKVSSGKIEFENISFNIMEKFESTIDSYAIKASQKNIELGLFIDPNLPTEVIGDSNRISQVLLNLLSNAIKFTPNNGQVLISIEKTAETSKEISIQFSVKDSGIGIEEDKKSKIFDAFSQADADTSRKFGGTGLGLTISSKFVELMQGELKIKSKIEKGSTFFFTLALKRSNSAKMQVHTKYPNLKVGYIQKNRFLANEIDKNIETYITHLSPNFQTYNEYELLESKYLPDILFIDEQYITQELLKRYLGLESHIVLISTANSKILKGIPKNKISKVIYKPLNFSKTLQTLELLTTTHSRNQVQSKIRETFENMNILVAEDNLINQKLIFNILKNLNSNVKLASNGKEVVKLFKEGQYDIVLMDIEMPLMSGIEASVEIINYEKSLNKKHTPIIALTANTTSRDKEKYLKSGMDGYLEKPLHIVNLKTILKKYFQKKEKNILLYKDTRVSGKIYKAILNNLGYKVDISYSDDEFKNKVSNKTYEFVIFDPKPLSSSNTKEAQNEILNLIETHGATPLTFTDTQELKKFLKQA